MGIVTIKQNFHGFWVSVINVADLQRMTLEAKSLAALMVCQSETPIWRTHTKLCNFPNFVFPTARLQLTLPSENLGSIFLSSYFTISKFVDVFDANRTIKLSW